MTSFVYDSVDDVVCLMQAENKVATADGPCAGRRPAAVRHAGAWAQGLFLFLDSTTSCGTLQEQSRGAEIDFGSHHVPDALS